MRTTALLTILILSFSWTGCRTHTANVEETSLGKKEFQKKCQSCHKLPKPTSKTDSEWVVLVPRYGKKAKLTDDQIKRITVYLTENN
jgi:cytochrome c2